MVKNKPSNNNKSYDLIRSDGAQDPFDRILIVCEGKKTEPAYFSEIKNKHRLPTAYVRILSGSGTAPIQIIGHAEKLFKEGCPGGSFEKESFDKIYAVFDRDNHHSYFDALNKADRLHNTLINDERDTVPFIAIPSNPCFELWLLLHYKDVNALMTCKNVITELQNHYSNYAKSSRDTYSITERYLADAFRRANTIKQRTDKSSDSHPVTYVDELVEVLQNLRSEI